MPFVLVHGLASNLRLWDGVAEELHARGHTVVAVDQRGHGRSDAPESSYGLDTAVGDLLALIEALGLSRPVVAGQSWGGNVVLELGWRHPAAVRGIICVDGGDHRAGRLVSLVGGLSRRAHAAAPRPPDAGRARSAHARVRARTCRTAPSPPRSPASACARTAGSSRASPVTGTSRSCARSGSIARRRATPTLETPTLLVLADTGDEARTAAKRRAEAQARAAAPRLQSHWFSPAHHDVHSQYPRSRGRPLRHRGPRRLLRMKARPGSSSSWARARPRPRW